MKKRIITITGALGSGKSSTANGVAKALGYRRFSAGDFQRASAASLGLTYEEFQNIALGDPKYDRMADDAQIAAGNDSAVVIDSRLGYHFIPDSFKVFLALAPEVAAERILEDAKTNPDRHNETTHGAHDLAHIAAGIRERLVSERTRYREHYGIDDHFDPAHFDLVIDTARYPLPEVVRRVTDAYQAWLAA